MIHQNLFETKAALFASLSKALSEELSTALSFHDTMTLYVSGGSTPRPVYENLSEHDIDWSQVHVALVDERWVPETDQASNAGMVKRSLLQHKAATATFQGMYLADHDIQHSLTVCEAAYGALPETYRLCLLGMGPDGHTASLFPEAEGLETALTSQQHCAVISARPSVVTGEHCNRMTLTRQAILACDKVFLLFTGADKWQVFEQALLTKERCRFPVSTILQQNDKDIELYWSP